MLRLHICWLFLCFMGTTASAQSSSNADRIAFALEQAIKKGDKKALRDMGTMLNHPQASQKALSILNTHLLVPSQILDLSNKIDKKTFLDFYYTHHEKINFSQLTGLWYYESFSSMPVEFQTAERNDVSLSSFQVKLRGVLEGIQKAMDRKDPSGLIAIFEEIKTIDQPEGYEFLIKLLEQREFDSFKKKHQIKIYQQLADVLANYPHTKSLNTLLKLMNEENLSAHFILPLLRKLTNIDLEHSNADAESVSLYYAKFRDSLGSIYAMRQYGYQRHYHFSPSFFMDLVDYYGKIFHSSEHLPWVKYNAWRDLCESGQPRALFYIASQVYKQRNAQSVIVQVQNILYLTSIRRLTHLDVQVKDQSGKWINDFLKDGDATSYRHFILYWANHYPDYEWDNIYQCFNNKTEIAKITKNYERLFRRLNSKNDSAAVQAYIALTEGDPMRIIPLAQKYRQLLRSSNDKVPSLQHQYLEQLVQLTDYCKKNKISYAIKDQIKPLIDQLSKNLSYSERYIIEEKVLSQVNIEDITALEYFGLINEYNIDLSYSLGRIIDMVYSLHWDKVVASSNSLRLYLKKAALFQQIGVFGSCNHYAIKLKTGTEMKDVLEDIASIETDAGMLLYFDQLLEKEEVFVQDPVDQFLQDPLVLDQRELAILPAPNEEQLLKIKSTISTTEDPRIIKNLFSYLRQKHDKKMVEPFSAFVGDERVVARKGKRVLTVGSLTGILMEKILDFPWSKMKGLQPAEAWQMWKEEHPEPEKWAAQCYELRIAAMDQGETIDIESLNSVSNSVYYHPRYKQSILKLIKKVKPFRDIQKLKLKTPLDVNGDLAFFDDFFFDYKILGDICKLFEIRHADVELMVQFTLNKSSKFSLEERGAFYNNLFRQDWLHNYVHNPNSTAAILHPILDILQEYYDNSLEMSEYEEQTTVLNMAQIENIALPVADQLQRSFMLDLDEKTKFKIQESILARISFEEIVTVVPILDQLSAPSHEKDPIAFLSRDFGLPIFGYPEPSMKEKLERRLSEHSEEEVYKIYLREFGLVFEKKKKQLDFERIYDMLTYDLVTPFVSRTGGKRDLYMYGLVKVLENHFGTRLGFHEKLNENQTFYSYTTLNRIEAWKNFLEESKLVRKVEERIPSFSGPSPSASK